MHNLTTRDNILKAIRFERPQYIPVTFHINPSCYSTYPQEALFDLMEEHPFLFPDFKRPDVPYVPDYALCARKDSPYTDDFGCLWTTTTNGITGTVTKHPLESWSDYDTYKFPDPSKCRGIGPMDWSEERRRISTATY